MRALGLAVVLGCAGAASGSPPLRSRHHRVDIRDVLYEPRELRVAPGDTVSWIHRGIVPHTVTATDAGWDSGELAPGAEFTLVAAGTGTVHYVCRYHATMTGRLLVR